MTDKKPSLFVLGSSSPRRLDLVRQIGIEPDHVIGPDIDETPLKNEKPDAYCMRIALEKNKALHGQFPDAFIVTADTTVVVGRRILGKAEDEEEAKRMVRLLSGRAHRVYTAVAIRYPDGRIVQRLSKNRVKVKVLHDDEIDSYLALRDWVGVAGAYRLQGHFAKYIIGMTGSHTGIIGLPLFETAQMLRGGGYPV